MEGLGHGAEIFAQPGRLAAGDGQRAERLVEIEAAQFRGGRSRCEGSAGAGRMEAFLVVARRDGLGDLAFHLDAEMVGEHCLGA